MGRHSMLESMRIHGIEGKVVKPAIQYLEDGDNAYTDITFTDRKMREWMPSFLFLFYFHFMYFNLF